VDGQQDDAEGGGMSTDLNSWYRRYGAPDIAPPFRDDATPPPPGSIFTLTTATAEEARGVGWCGCPPGYRLCKISIPGAFIVMAIEECDLAWLNGLDDNGLSQLMIRMAIYGHPVCKPM
jgi:hypothetical protein